MSFSRRPTTGPLKKVRVIRMDIFFAFRATCNFTFWLIELCWKIIIMGHCRFRKLCLPLVLLTYKHMPEVKYCIMAKVKACIVLCRASIDENEIIWPPDWFLTTKSLFSEYYLMKDMIQMIQSDPNGWLRNNQTWLFALPRVIGELIAFTHSI